MAANLFASRYVEGITYVTVVVVLSLAAAFLFPGLFPLEDVTLYLTVAGLIYGLFAAFAIGVSWDRYSRIVEYLHEEVGALINIHELVKHITDRKSAHAINKQMLDYLTHVTSVQWKDYFDSEESHKKFRKLFALFGNINMKGEKDAQLFDDVGDDLKDASRVREQQLVLSNTPLSPNIWALLLLLSGSVVVGVFTVEFTNTILGVFTKFIMSLSSFVILFVIHQIDALELAAKEIEEEPIKKLIKLIKSEHRF